MKKLIPLRIKLALKPLLLRILHYRKLWEEKRSLIEELNQFVGIKPLISIIYYVHEVDFRLLQLFLESVEKQIYTNWELCIYDNNSQNSKTREFLEKFKAKRKNVKLKRSEKTQDKAFARNEATKLSQGEYLYFFDNDSQLNKYAFFWIIKEINKSPKTDIFLTSGSNIDSSGLVSTKFSIYGYSSILLHGFVDFPNPIIVRKDLFEKIQGFNNTFSEVQIYDFFLRASEANVEFKKISNDCLDRRFSVSSGGRNEEEKTKILESAKLSLEAHIDRVAGKDLFVSEGNFPSSYRVRRKNYEGLRVSILILTNNSKRTLESKGSVVLVENLVKSILEKTTFSNYKITVVDNRNTSSELSAFFKEKEIDLISFELLRDQGFNYSKKVNFAMNKITEEYVILLNDDMEIIEPNWIESLLDYGTALGVGIVGSKLLYENNKIQHAGIILNPEGIVVHCHYGKNDGIVPEADLPRNFLAVTGACILFKKSLFERIGGFDENLAIDYNDIDFCLRAGNLGYGVVYNPYCRLYHYEQSTLKRNARNQSEDILFQERWAHLIDNDPFRN